MDQRTINLTAGLLVPSFGSVVFNALNQLIEKGPTAPVPSTVFDFAIGCAFTIVGIAASQKTAQRVTENFLTFVILLLVLMALNIVLAHYMSSYQLATIWLSNFISLAAVAVSIWKS